MLSFFSKRMVNFMQYDLFQDDDIEALHIEIANLRKTISNLRKGLFARHGELSRVVSELRAEMNEIKQITAKKKAELVPFFGDYIEVTN